MEKPLVGLLIQDIVDRSWLPVEEHKISTILPTITMSL